MVDEATAAPAEGEAVFTPSLPADTGPVDARAAARAMTEQRLKALQPPEAKAEQPRDKGRFTSAAAGSGGAQAAQTESTSQEGDAAAAEQPPGDTADADPAETPSIEPPRSWTKEDKEAFRLLPPDRQQSIVDTERRRDAEIRRGQDDVANERKAIEAERQATLQARTQYEQAAQNALSILQTQQAAEFGDIKTDADVMKLATDDPFRFSQWQARQMQIQNQQRDVQALGQRREQEQAEQFKTWSKEQDDKFSKRYPEFSDPEKGPKLRASVTSYLTKDVGIPEELLPKLWNEPLFRDEKLQGIIYEASRFRAAQQQAKSAVQKPVPQVQRPGSAPTKGSQLQDQIAAATDRLKTAKGMEATRAAADLMALRRQGARH